MASNTTLKNMSASAEETKFITLSRKELEQGHLVRYQAGEIFEDNEIHWCNKRGKKGHVGWEDGCAVIDGVLYACVCDGMYFDENAGGSRFVVGAKHLPEVLDANHCVVRIMEVLDEDAPKTPKKTPKKTKREPVEESVEESEEESEEDSEDEE